MVDIALGGDRNGNERFQHAPFLKAHISPIVSPLKFGEEAVLVAMACIEEGLPLSCITAALSGRRLPRRSPGFSRSRWPKRWPA